jgi:hypothetical protein
MIRTRGPLELARSNEIGRVHVVDASFFAMTKGPHLAGNQCLNMRHL